METLQYRIDNCLEQARTIKAEHPNVSSISFNLNECGYEETKVVAERYDKKINIDNGMGGLCLVESYAESDYSCFIHVYTKKLIVSEPVIVEE